MHLLFRLLGLAGLLGLSMAASAALVTEFDANQAIERSQAVVGQELGEYALLDRYENPVSLADLRGKPLVLSFIYTSCHHVCPTLTRSLKNAVEVARDALGEDSFNIVSVGFDAAVDTPERMRVFAAQQGVDMPQWRFLSASPEAISQLADDAGFTWFASPKGFDHLTQTSIVDAEGRVYRQLYGTEVVVPSFVEPLKTLVWGREANPVTVDGWINSVKLFCTVYDPTSGIYRFDYSIVIAAVVGGLCLFAVAVFLVRAWRGSRVTRPVG